MARVDPPIPLFRRTGRPPAAESAAELRECPHHGLIEHYAFKRENGKIRWSCKRCVGEAVTRRHQKVKRILVAEAGGCCAVCAYDRTVVNLHFHHVPAEKSFNVNPASGKSLDAYREEALKCVLLCANCHGEIESGLIPSPPAGSRHPALMDA